MDSNDGVQGLEHSGLYGSCVWQHKAARHDARVVGEAVTDDGGQHGPGQLASACWRCVVEHISDGRGERNRLLGPLRNLACSLGACGVQGSSASCARFGAQDRKAFTVVSNCAGFAPSRCEKWS